MPPQLAAGAPQPPKPMHLPFSVFQLGAAALVALGAMLAGCGGSVAGEAKSYGPGPGGIDEALADLDANEAEIASRFGLPATGAAYPSAGYPGAGYPAAGYGAQPGYQQAPGQPSQPYAQPPPPPPPPPVASTPVQSEPPKPADAPAAGPASPPSPAEPASRQSDEEASDRTETERCETACRALGSMKRAAEHVCRAAGSSDPRCGRARDRVAAASARVAASCEDCDG